MTVRLVAFSDNYIPVSYMERGLASLASQGVDVEVRNWERPTLEALQQVNLAVEQGGPDAVELEPSIVSDLAGAHLLVAQFMPIPRALIEAAVDLRAICVLRTGTENVDVACATQRGICVLNTPGRNARAVAECTVGMMLCEMRNLARAHAALVSGGWTRDFPNRDAIPELSGKTVGLIGYGAVGRLVAELLAGFQCEILAHDPLFHGDVGPARMTELDPLLRQSDVVSLHARLTPETRHLIGAEELARMKPSAILINTARSGLVDEAALVAALKTRQIMGAAVDVFDEEPLPLEHPLRRLDNVTLLPHLAGSTVDAFRNSPRLAASHIARMLSGEGDLPIVNRVASPWA